MSHFGDSMARVMRPASLLMHRLRLPGKLALLALLTLAPLGFFTLQTLWQEKRVVDAAHAELRGSRALPPLFALAASLQTHRGQTNALLHGDKSAEAKLQGTRAELTQALEAAEAVLEGGKPWDLSTRWDEVRGAARQLAAGQVVSEAGAAFAQHTRLIEAVQSMSLHIGERSGILLEPEPMPHFLAVLAVERLLPWQEQVAQMRGVGSGVLAAGEATLQQRASLRTALDAAAAAARASETTLASLLREGGVQPASWPAALAAAQQFGALTRSQALADMVAGDAGAYFAQGSDVLKKLQTLQSETLQAMEQVLEARSDAADRHFRLYVLLVLVLMVLSLYLMAGFYFDFMRALGLVRHELGRFAAGDLTPGEGGARKTQDEMDEILGVLDKMGGSISALVADIRNSASMVSQAGQNLTADTGDLARRTEQQAAAVQQTTASLADLSETVDANAATARRVDGLAGEAKAVVARSAEVMQGAVDVMHGIESDSRKVKDIISLIDGIAFQTNLLSLNAAVEAARAGEQGRGFAVVAGEVRQLAQRSAGAAQDIKRLIDQSASQIGQGVAHIGQLKHLMDDVVNSIGSVAEHMGAMSEATASQSTALAQVAAAMAQIDELTQQNGAMVERAHASASGLENRADKLSEAVEHFQLRQGVAEEARQLVQQAAALVREQGQGALRAITDDPGKRFADRDMYVFAFNRQGAYTAFAGKPERVGRSLFDVPGLNAAKLVDEAFAIGEGHSGWVDYDIPNPVTGKIEHKTSFIVRIHASTVIGCGVYRSS
ncbi:methyl-accepting chemotaxis protein [Massilia sp. TS11]|uniref:methyl-accepting chemotaxis protein n=1 Tax=Massilia sp. TS11 TaxID=2908003 RepID=UPI001EDBC1CC|nr:methyl-accepting chemotaxis protein [Massilia sp. TS11]MCG2584319.1 methyl-accepting chemotaxis protein [Massilia sp. TS11]